MVAIGKLLVIGGGSAGAATAILLADAGVQVDLVEAQPATTALGSGITLQGNALRVLDELGVLGECLTAGYPFLDVAIRAPGPEATVLAEMHNVRTGGPDLPAAMGMYRPDLARILMARADKAGVAISFGTTVTHITQTGDGAQATFSDGRSKHFDLVVGADGVRSATRRMLGIDLDTRTGGVGIWRLFAHRPVNVARSELYYGGGGDTYYAGYTPTSESTLYAHINEPAQDRRHLDLGQMRSIFHELSRPYGGPWDEIRAQLDQITQIHYTWAESHLLDLPWHRQRTLLIGDAVHTCPPTIAQGAAMALEDASVLASMLIDSDQVDDDLLTDYADRRRRRVKQVVDASNQILEWTVAREQGPVAEVMARIAAMVSELP